MSIRKITVIECDGHGCERARTAREGQHVDSLVDEAVRDGWRNGGFLHTCPTCAAEPDDQPILLVPTGATTSQEN